MPVWIVAHSDALCNFLLPLLVELSGPQQQPALNVTEALLVCTRLKHRTLAALTRVLRVPHADVTAALQPSHVQPFAIDLLREDSSDTPVAVSKQFHVE